MVSKLGKFRIDVKVDNKKRTVIFQKPYYQDKLFGEVKYYFDNGNVERIENYIDNKKHGQTLMFDEFGDIISEFDYKNNLLDGYSRIYRNGKLIIETLFSKGVEYNG